MLKAAVTSYNAWKDLIEQMKGENNQMDFDFNVGDYVEKSSGVIGFITDVYDTNCFKWICVKGDSDLLEGEEYISSVINTASKNWRRIGKYDFTKLEPKQIEQLTYAESYINGYQILTGRKLIDKINELVDAVNELRGDRGNA